ncbi:MAG: hypothetical protein IJB43_08245 [Clostridia bacterium]|nr:hypothetical protein [Clostridia bacterium]
MICVCDYRTPKGVLDSLKKDFEIIQLPPDTSLPEAVNGHSDLLIFKIDNKLVTRKSYYRTAKDKIDLICDKGGLELVLSETKAGDKYPSDCGLCAAVSGRKIICRKASTDVEILRLADDPGYNLLNVPQGYSKCSCAVLADGAIITADRGIAKVTLENGIDTLLISEGNVELPGYAYGFIGGATGLCKNTLYFCGNLESHPDHTAIEEFARKHSTKCVSLSEEKLYDVGSLLFISKQA